MHPDLHAKQIQQTDGKLNHPDKAFRNILVNINAGGGVLFFGAVKTR